MELRADGGESVCRHDTISVFYRDIASVNFMVEALRTDCDYPLVVTQPNGSYKGGFVHVVVLGFWRGQQREERQCSS